MKVATENPVDRLGAADLQPRRRPLLQLQALLPHLSLRAPARVRGGLPAADAARQGGAGPRGRRHAAGQVPGRHRCRRHGDDQDPRPRQLGQPQRLQPHADGADGRHPPRSQPAALGERDLRHLVGERGARAGRARAPRRAAPDERPRRCSSTPASRTTTTPRWPRPRWRCSSATASRWPLRRCAAAACPRSTAATSTRCLGAGARQRGIGSCPMCAPATPSSRPVRPAPSCCGRSTPSC